MGDAEITSFGPFTLDRQRQALRRDGEPVTVGHRGYVLLETLLGAQGATVDKATLLEKGWPGTIVEEGNLSVQIAALRKALGDRPDGSEWIVTVPRMGYRLISTQSSSRTDVGAMSKPAVAVLPFANLSANPEHAFFADGIVDDLIIGLSRFSTFSVIARNSAFTYKDRAADVRDIGKELGVRYVLEGAVRRAGGQVRVSTDLVDAATGSTLWVEQFDTRIDDIFEVQDKIARAVIGLIEPQIRRAEIERVRQKRPDSLGAWELCIQSLPKLYALDLGGYSEAIALLDRAIKIDPEYGFALILCAWAHEKRLTFGGSSPSVDDGAAALALAEQALAAAPEDPIVLVFAGYFRILLSHDHSALVLCTQALSRCPNNLLVLNIAGLAHHFSGDIHEVLRCNMRALELSPGAPDNYISLLGVANAQYALGRFEEALDYASRAVDLNRSNLYGLLYVACSNAQLGRPAEAKLALDEALQLRPDLTIEAQLSANRFRESDRIALWADGLRKAGLRER